jgi:hypothetical protein
MPHDFRSIRTIFLVILAIGLVGTGTELLFLSHDEDLVQLVPLVLIGLGLVAIAWYAISGSPWSVRALRITMAAFVAAGGLGIALHYQANKEFTKEVDPSIEGYTMFMKAMQSKTPPALAPGSMAQLGLLGLACTFRIAKGREKT